MLVGGSGEHLGLGTERDMLSLSPFPRPLQLQILLQLVLPQQGETELSKGVSLDTVMRLTECRAQRGGLGVTTAKGRECMANVCPPAMLLPAQVQGAAGSDPASQRTEASRNPVAHPIGPQSPESTELSVPVP